MAAFAVRWWSRSMPGREKRGAGRMSSERGGHQVGRQRRAKRTGRNRAGHGVISQSIALFTVQSAHSEGERGSAAGGGDLPCRRHLALLLATSAGLDSPWR